MKNLLESLSLARSKVPYFDFLLQVLVSLNGEYNPIVVQLSKEEDVSWIEFQSTLLAFESRLDQLTLIAQNVISTQFAHLAALSSPRGGWSAGRGGCSSCGRGCLGRGGEKPYCALYEKTCHHVKNCFKYFDFSFKPPTNNNSNKSSFSDSGVNQNSVFYASLEVVSDCSWYLDSGATTHVTNYASRLDNPVKNDGKTQLFVANGQNMKVDQISCSKIQNVPGQCVKLSNVFYAPTSKRNLLSIPKLSNDNDVFVLLKSKNALVRKQGTRTTLL